MTLSYKILCPKAKLTEDKTAWTCDPTCEECVGDAWVVVNVGEEIVKLVRRINRLLDQIEPLLDDTETSNGDNP